MSYFNSRIAYILKIFCLIGVLILGSRSASASVSDSLQAALQYHQASQFDKALPIFISLSEKFKAKNDIANYALCRVKMADIVRNYGGVNLALEMLHENQKLIKIKIEKLSPILAENYLAEAEALYAASRFTEFKYAIQNSIGEKRKLSLPEKYLAEDYLHLSRYYKAVPNQNDSCYYWLAKSLRLAKVDKKTSRYLLPRIYNMMGYFFHPVGSDIPTGTHERKKRLAQYELSRAYYDTALSLIKSQPTPDRLMEAKVFHNLGNSYSNEMGINKELFFKNALTNYRKSLSLLQTYGSPNDQALKYWVMAVLFHRYGLPDSAIATVNRGIEKLVPNFKISTPSDLPQLQPTLDDNWFASLIRIKAGYYFKKYEMSKHVDDLIQAYQYYKYTLRFNMYLISKAGNEEESSFRNYMYSLNSYHDLLEIAFKLYIVTSDQNYVKDVYGLLAKSKYAYLNRNDFNPILSKEISHSVLNEELKLVKQNILKMIPSLTNAELTNALPTIPENDNGLKLAQVNLSRQISDTLRIKDLQDRLRKEGATLIDFYYLNLNYLLTITIHGNTFSMTKHKLQDNFISLTRLMKKWNTSASPKEYAKISNRIYTETLDSLLSKIPKEENHLIICSDSFLQNIAWDALVTDTLNIKSYKELSYLLKRFTLRTILSPSHLLRAESKSQGYLGVASSYSISRHFSSIPFSYALVKNKSQELKGKFSERLSENDSSNVAILHVAAHVKNDSLRPYNSSVYFGDHDSATIGSLSHTKVSAHLVILNGCQTGNGTYYQSDGTISLARAFYRTGAQSALITLWNVDDKTSAEVLSNFYDEIEKGKELDVSLRNAKLKFIANAPTDELANPYYWGGIQMSGANTPVWTSDFYKSAIAWLIGMGLIGIIFNSIRRNKLAKHL
ncbi:MAG: CHAT domain-containing protein [Bacteroidetes bacterium]|nr:CHAT domain-containing protein [Bacteroidota bacterium]